MKKEKLKSKLQQRCFVGVRLKMRPCDAYEGRSTADEQRAESAASSCSRNTERLSVTDADKQISRMEFPTDIYLLIEQNQSHDLIDFNFNFKLEPSVAKLVCVRTSSKGYPPCF